MSNFRKFDMPWVKFGTGARYRAVVLLAPDAAIRVVVHFVGRAAVQGDTLQTVQVVVCEAFFHFMLSVRAVKLADFRI